jgi:hypothetical protein
MATHSRFVFNRNLDGEVQIIARTSHLFLPFPDTIRNDMAFQILARLPAGLEAPVHSVRNFTATAFQSAGAPYRNDLPLLPQPSPGSCS